MYLGPVGLLFVSDMEELQEELNTFAWDVVERNITNARLVWTDEREYKSFERVFVASVNSLQRKHRDLQTITVLEAIADTISTVQDHASINDLCVLFQRIANQRYNGNDINFKQLVFSKDLWAFVDWFVRLALHDKSAIMHNMQRRNTFIREFFEDVHALLVRHQTMRFRIIMNSLARRVNIIHDHNHDYLCDLFQKVVDAYPNQATVNGYNFRRYAQTQRSG